MRRRPAGKAGFLPERSADAPDRLKRARHVSELTFSGSQISKKCMPAGSEIHKDRGKISRKSGFLPHFFRHIIAEKAEARRAASAFLSFARLGT